MKYFAILHKNKNNQFEVSFPDLAPATATFGDTLEEAIESAHDSLTGYLLTAEDYNEVVTAPTNNPSIFKIQGSDIIVPVEVNLEFERIKEQNN